MSGTLRERVERAVDRAGTVSVDADGIHAEVEVSDSDRIGVVVERVRVEGGEGPVDQRARAIAEQVRPGGEVLKPIEVAPELGGAVLRTPRDPADGGRYYQVDIDATGAELTRHRVDGEGRRHQQGFALTRDQLGRLVDQMGRAVGETAE